MLELYQYSAGTSPRHHWPAYIKECSGAQPDDLHSFKEELAVSGVRIAVLPADLEDPGEAAFQASQRLWLQRRLDRRDHLWRIRRHIRLKASDRLSVAGDEEFGEVPLNLAANVGRRSEVLIERRLIVALYRDLRHHRKLHVELGAAELFDLCIGPGLLVAEVVRRHADDHQALVLVLLVDGLERGVLRREAAGAGDVDHQQHLALVDTESGGVTIDGAQFEIVDGRAGTGHGHAAEEQQHQHQVDLSHGQLQKSLCAQCNRAADFPDASRRLVDQWSIVKV